MLAAVEDSSDIDGLLVILNTVGGDVEAGLAICGDDSISEQTDEYLLCLAAVIQSACL